MAEHWCKEHGVAFFKKGNMKGYAHPIVNENGESTGKWCNEPKEQAEKPQKQWIPSGKSPEERISIERQKSADIAFQHIGNNETIEITLARAELIFQWIHNGMNTVADVVKETSTETPKPKPATPATAEQKKQLAEFEKKRPGRIAEIMKEQGLTRELTKTQANIVQTILITEEETRAKK